MPAGRSGSGLGSKTLAILVGVFCMACLLGYLVVRDAVNKTVEHQALAIAQIVADQASVARSVYASEIAGKLSRDGFGPSVDFEHRPGHVPIPAQFLKLVGLASAAASDRLYDYKPVSKWNLEPTQGLTDDFLQWAWPQLERQDRPAPSAPIPWVPVYRFEERAGARVLRFLAADPASQASCAACHNAYEKLPSVVALREAAGVPPGRVFAQHQLLGALSVTIPLDKAEKVAGSKITQATVFFFGILAASFLALIWFNWRLGLQRLNLSRAQQQLARSELQARDANALLQAKQGVEQAFAELTTYMQGVDQHALVSVTNPEGRIVQVNDKFVQISGHDRPALMGQDHRLLSSGFHDSAFFGQMWNTIQRGEIWRDVVCNRSREGALYWVDLAIVPLKDPAGQVVRFIAVGIDITEQRRHEETLHYQATHDVLTELPNRALLLERMARAVVRAGRRQQLVVVFFIDLDKFKQINDSLGHGTGDQVLCEMARRLQDLARGGDTVARLGGDEFVMVCEGLTRDAVEPFGARIHTALLAPVVLQGEPHALGGSVGVALFPDHGDDVETLLKRADIAMFEAKRQSSRGVCIFSPEMQDAIDGRVQMEARLREGIGRGELVLHYQPQVDFETGALVSLEALLRWNSPDYGFLMPGQFIGLAEESRLIAEIDAFVLGAACRQMQQWHQRGHGWIRTAVNLAATKFSDPLFKTELREAMERHGIPAGVLELEVTESLAMRDPDAALVLMRELKSQGILLSVDDFGTGYSNLGYLKRFPADRLKVDQSFVRGLLKSPQDRAIVAAVVRLAHNLNMRAIAEGVETEDEAILLYSLDVDEIQGYWMARPQPAEAVEKLFDQPMLLDPTAFLQHDALPVVLLVEDDEVTRELIEHLLVSFGVRVVSADSAEQAMQLFHQHAYAVAIVDHWLPGTSGIELLGQIRKRMPHTVRVLMTVSNDPQVLRDAINIGGVAHFLAKPVDPAAMRNVVVDACWKTVAQRRHQPPPG
ncbi:EAL domain-containing protein [Pseudorhodoferax sp.]|uniref:EAL domain-containing protein n=1 Tax=Pseudorhodoferax sp. TaxID=1993553 RepID=UPI002DD67067|nr:EAL domain-containing protein [Pseudorhodoferax sp.]